MKKFILTVIMVLCGLAGTMSAQTRAQITIIRRQEK